MMCDAVCSLRSGGHIYYVSVRDNLGLCALIDASECKPTFGASEYRLLTTDVPTPRTDGPQSYAGRVLPPGQSHGVCALSNLSDHVLI